MEKLIIKTSIVLLELFLTQLTAVKMLLREVKRNMEPRSVALLVLGLETVLLDATSQMTRESFTALLQVQLTATTTFLPALLTKGSTGSVTSEEELPMTTGGATT